MSVIDSTAQEKNITYHLAYENQNSIPQFNNIDIPYSNIEYILLNQDIKETLRNKKFTNILCS